MLAAILSFGVQANAGQINKTAEGGTAWNAGLDGVIIEFDARGEFSRIYSKYTQPVSIPNTRGIRTAKTIAEEKAKASIIKFIEQEVSSSTFVIEVSTDIERSSAVSGSGRGVSISSEASNTMLTSLTELNGSASRGTLRGVIRLEEGYDASSGEAWVKVGFSNKTMQMAGTVRDAIANDGRQQSDTSPDTTSEGQQKSPQSHVRKTDQKDW